MAHPIKLPIVFRFFRVPIRWAIIQRTGVKLSDSLLVGELDQKGSKQQIDGWQCRQEFLKLPEGDNEALCRFMNRVGLWESDAASPSQPVKGYWIDKDRRLCLQNEIDLQ